MISKAFYKQIEENSQSLIGNEPVEPKGENPESQDGNEIKSLFSIQTANKWLDTARQRPAPKMLFGELWCEGEICILFADTNVGKSILATQIANDIGKGKNEEGLKVEVEPQPIIYFDFELSDKQFEARYSVKEDDYFTNHYKFSENLHRAEINPNNFLPDFFNTFEEYLN